MHEPTDRCILLLSWALLLQLIYVIICYLLTMTIGQKILGRGVGRRCCRHHHVLECPYFFFIPSLKVSTYGYNVLIFFQPVHEIGLNYWFFESASGMPGMEFRRMMVELTRCSCREYYEIFGLVWFGDVMEWARVMSLLYDPHIACVCF